MLSTIQQRHSFILQKATDQVKSEKEDPLVKETIDQVIIALSMVNTLSPTHLHIIANWVD